MVAVLEKIELIIVYIMNKNTCIKVQLLRKGRDTIPPTPKELLV